MRLRKLNKWLSKQASLILSIIISILVIAFIITMSRMNINLNIESRALSELQSTVSMQASAVANHVDEQYQALQLVVNLVKEDNEFGSKEFQPTLSTIVETFRLCTLCMADTEGNTIDYEGNVLGNCSDRNYFQKILNGETKQFCEYLGTTKLISEPRVIFSVPAYDKNNNLIGIIFCSKEISVLEDSLFAHSDLFDSSSSILICQEQGNIIVANENAYNTFYTNKTDNEILNINTLDVGFDGMREDGVSSRQFKINNKTYFASCIKLEMGEWYLYCIVDKANVSDTFYPNQKRIENTIWAMFFVFVLAFIYIIFLGILYLKRKTKDTTVIKQNYENYKNILKEAKCAVIEYNFDTSRLNAIQSELGTLKFDSLNGNLDTYKQLKQSHPEYDFDELETELELAKKNGKTYSFESFVTIDKNLCWLQTIIFPVLDEDGFVQKILFAIFDVSDIHMENDNFSEMYMNIPGGVYRCNLDNQFLIEYFGDGLCKMLGYTRNEVNKIIGTEKDFSRLIYEDDRPIFMEFVQKMAKYGGLNTCEYRMRCSSGYLLTVMNSMDAKRSSAGTMYGYSIVTDLSKYKEKQQGLEKELDEVKLQLRHSRIRNASSQMQPHFLYNALSSIREIILENPQYASDLIYDFTVHLRACIRSITSDNLISFSQELENVKAYVNIEKMRFGDKLKVMYDCQETEFDIIPLSIQPLVENAIRHGVYERGLSGGTVTISSFKENESVVVYVEDNGVGFDYEKVMDEIKTGKRDSNGLYNLIFRFETLMHAQIKVDSKIDYGTKITITIPQGDQNESNIS